MCLAAVPVARPSTGVRRRCDQEGPPSARYRAALLPPLAEAFQVLGIRGQISHAACNTPNSITHDLSERRTVLPEIRCLRRKSTFQGLTRKLVPRDAPHGARGIKTAH